MSSSGCHVRLFRNGRNQALRIPREFGLEGEEALMHKEGDRLIVDVWPSLDGRMSAAARPVQGTLKQSVHGFVAKASGAVSAPDGCESPRRCPPEVR